MSCSSTKEGSEFLSFTRRAQSFLRKIGKENKFLEKKCSNQLVRKNHHIRNNSVQDLGFSVCRSFLQNKEFASTFYNRKQVHHCGIKMSRQFFWTIVSSGFVVSATVVSNESTAELEFLTSRFAEQITLSSPIGPPKPPSEGILSLLAVAKSAPLWVSRHIPRGVTDNLMLRPLRGPLEAVEVITFFITIS